jgi:hypothetical protein
MSTFGYFPFRTTVAYRTTEHLRRLLALDVHPPVAEQLPTHAATIT